MKRICFLTASVLLALPLLGQAYEAYTVDDVQLQAGPDEAYPTITELPAGAEVALQGCIDGWSWCDVIAGQDRGWVPASYLEEDYDNRRVTVVDYGPRIGIPVVGFSLGVYWGQHYHNRPWYNERVSWEHRHITPRAMPRPSNVAHRGDVRGGADVSVRDQHEHATTASGQTRETRHDTASAATQTSGSNAPAQSARSSARISEDNYALKNAKNHGEHSAESTAQNSQKSTPNVRQDERDGAHHQMPPQVQTARTNTPTQQQPQRSEQRDQGRQQSERKNEKDNKGDNKDHDRDDGH